MLISAAQSALLVVDVQARLAPAIAGREAAMQAQTLLLEAARRLDVPVLASEQYPRGLGPTVPEIAGLLPEGATVEKIHFSCQREPAFAERLAALARPQAVVCGFECHVCVLQTVIDLVGAGYQTFVVADACGSRLDSNKTLGLERMRQAGATVVSAEMVVFEWLGAAGTDTFREVSRLLK